MITNHDPIDACLHRLPRISNGLNPFQTKRLPSTDAFPLLHHPRQPLPRMGFAMPNMLIDPLRADLELDLRILGVGVKTSFPASLEEHRV
jgi:hypothetical protein